MDSPDYAELTLPHFRPAAHVWLQSGNPHNMFTGTAGQREHGTLARIEARIDGGVVR